MPSLAAHLNNAVEGNWIGVFKYAESFYLVAVRDDAVLRIVIRFILMR